MYTNTDFANKISEGYDLAEACKQLTQKGLMLWGFGILPDSIILKNV